MHYEDQIYGCAFQCPFEKRAHNCPFTQVDHFSVREKVSWMRNLMVEKKQSIIEYHLFCTNQRERNYSLKSIENRSQSEDTGSLISEKTG